MGIFFFFCVIDSFKSTLLPTYTLHMHTLYFVNKSKNIKYTVCHKVFGQVFVLFMSFVFFLMQSDEQ